MVSDTTRDSVLRIGREIVLTGSTTACAVMSRLQALRNPIIRFDADVAHVRHEPRNF